MKGLTRQCAKQSRQCPYAENNRAATQREPIRKEASESCYPTTFSPTGTNAPDENSAVVSTEKQTQRSRTKKTRVLSHPLRPRLLLTNLVQNFPLLQPHPTPPHHLRPCPRPLLPNPVGNTPLPQPNHPEANQCNHAPPTHWPHHTPPYHLRPCPRPLLLSKSCGKYSPTASC